MPGFAGFAADEPPIPENSTVEDENYLLQYFREWCGSNEDSGSSRRTRVVGARCYGRYHPLSQCLLAMFDPGGKNPGAEVEVRTKTDVFCKLSSAHEQLILCPSWLYGLNERIDNNHITNTYLTGNDILRYLE